MTPTTKMLNRATAMIRKWRTPSPELPEYNRKLGGKKSMCMLSSDIDVDCHYLKANVKQAKNRCERKGGI